jgi:uncharacterized SAM-binding protein YcdF (DUF218 family)
MPIVLPKIRRRYLLTVLIPVGSLLIVVIFAGTILRAMGALIVVDEHPDHTDAVVVLNTGVEYYPRLIQAADLYRRGLAAHVVINGNRKTETLRHLEHKGFQACCPWYADFISILTMLGVPEDRIISLSIEDAYDTVSEADAVGRVLLKRQWTSVIITTSKYHTRRARFIWQKLYQDRLNIYVVAAQDDPYDPNSWWQDGRQIRWLLAEYGAWIYYWWKQITGI